MARPGPDRPHVRHHSNVTSTINGTRSAWDLMNYERKRGGEEAKIDSTFGMDSSVVEIRSHDGFERLT